MNLADFALTSISPTLTHKSLASNTTLPQKSAKLSIPRIDVEPIYTQLKGALGNQWLDYKAAINAFVLGNLNQAELSWVLQPLLFPAQPIIVSTPSPVAIVQLHNQLITCIYANIGRDVPPSEVAPWVVATDKPSAAKNAGAVGASDKAEERLKREIMAIPARDRRRIKSIKSDTTGGPEGALREMLDYRFDLVANASDNALGTSDTSPTWNLDNRKKYAQPLASETLEFPSISDLQHRVESILQDEGFQSATQTVMQPFTELLEQAAETFIKSFLGEQQIHTRSNGIGCIQTADYKRQLRKEELDVERGTLQRTTIGQLPVEAEVQSNRVPLGEAGLRMAFEMRDPLITYDRFLAEKTALNKWPTFSKPPPAWTPHSTAIVRLDAQDDDVLMEDAPAWQGESVTEQNNLLTVLEDCLALA